MLKFRIFNYFFLFTEDQSEEHDLAEERPELVKEMYEKLLSYQKRYVDPDRPPLEHKGLPKYWNYTWSPGWC